MPLKVNVGLSRKVGEANYGSRGASVFIETELDIGLVREPDRLHQRIRQLFQLVRASLHEQLHGGQDHGNPPPSAPGGAVPEANAGNGAPAPGAALPARRGATALQIKALFAIARSQRLDLRRVVQERFGVSRPDDLSLRQASGLIEELKRSENQSGA
jgi:hypothetical protein